jgi:hypothetical protein
MTFKIPVAYRRFKPLFRLTLNKDQQSTVVVSKIDAAEKEVFKRV